jgi:hypothetical protein
MKEADMAFLSWISDQDLLEAYQLLYDAIERGIKRTEENLGRNIIDPFSTVFTLMFFKFDAQKWQDMEVFRQNEKTLSNAIGAFHQHILGCVDGWQNLGTESVVDIVNDERKIIAEIKNKYSTVKGSEKINIYKSLKDSIYDKRSKYQGYQAYYVTMIPRKPEGICKPFTPSDNKNGKKPPEDNAIMEIDGKRFYTLVTGSETALEDLFNAIPKIVAANHCHLKIDGASITFVKKLFDDAYN